MGILSSSLKNNLDNSNDDINKENHFQDEIQEDKIQEHKIQEIEINDNAFEEDESEEDSFDQDVVEEDSFDEYEIKDEIKDNVLQEDAIKEEIKKKFKKFDTNDDDLITWEEFEIEFEKKNGRKMDRNDLWEFLAMDNNSDTSVSLKEWNKYDYLENCD